MKKTVALFLFYCISNFSLAQVNLKYYLPDSVQYNPLIPTPKTILGYEIGEWHISHDQLVYYMKALDEFSDRIKIEEYARTYEKRPLLLLTITSPANHKNIQKIRQEHLDLNNPQKSGALDTDKMPIVLYMGYSVHGNEPSGANAAALVAYFLAAAQGAAIEKVLENTIILFDPCYNPDGLHRFSTWVNSHKSKNLVTDPNNRELNEPFPRGRTNHYWFDLNRDWLSTQHPESKGRIDKFQQWRPNILTDHHEMGSNATYFFQPGVPSRRNPLTPIQNQDLTAEIATYHAKALNKIRSLYYTKEGFDDFYYGKGSTYPDVHGAVGILFEQASSRGHAQETVNGILTFPFTILNQFTTAFSTLEAAQIMRKKMLDYQRDFYKSAMNEKGAYIFGSEYDKARNYHFLEILKRHQIEIYQLKSDFSAEGKNFKKESSYAVSLNQPQSRLIKAIFERQTQFQDSLFYDISSWTFPLAFNLPHVKTTAMPAAEKLDSLVFSKGQFIGGKSEIAYLFKWNEYYAPRALQRLLNKGIIAKVATDKFSFNIQNKEENFTYGTILIPLGIQNISVEEVENVLKEIADKDGMDIYCLNTGLAVKGVDFGSDAFVSLRKPQVLLVVGEGVNSNEAGEVWHLLDQRYDMQVSLLEQQQINTLNLQRYNTIVMVSGSYTGIQTKGIENLKNWLRNGNTLLSMGSAITWTNTQGISSVKFKNPSPATDSLKIFPYSDRENIREAQQINGAIFEANLDITHPLGYGYQDTKIPLFKSSTRFGQRIGNSFTTPLIYSKTPVLSGYISKKNLDLLKESVSVAVNHYEAGIVINFIDNPNFRAFWYGTNKLFANAIFFGKVISR